MLVANRPGHFNAEFDCLWIYESGKLEIFRQTLNAVYNMLHVGNGYDCKCSEWTEVTYQ